MAAADANLGICIKLRLLRGLSALGAACSTFQCENLRMHIQTLRPTARSAAFSPFHVIGAWSLSLSLSLLASPAFAQEANVLGLPAIPQAKPGAAVSPAGAASGAKPAPAGSAATPANRDALAGEMGIQHSALDGQGRIILTTRASFATAGARSNAIDAARAVQSDLDKACGKQCKPQKIGTPKILPSGQLEFELSFRPLYQHLNQAQFLAALQSRPLNLTPAQITAPVQAPPPISVSVQSSAPPPAATETK